MEIDFEIKGIDEMVRAFEEAPAIARREAKQAMTESLEILEGRTKVRTPVRSGKLWRGWKRIVRSTTSSVRGTLTNEIFYGWFQEFGTKYLAGRKMLTQALESSVSDINAAFDRVLDRLLRRMAG
jgi:hypothetical protein